MSLIIDGSSGITFPDSSKISNTKSLFSTGNVTLGSDSGNTVTINAGTVTLNNNTVISAATTKTLTLNGGGGSNGLVLDVNNNLTVGGTSTLGTVKSASITAANSNTVEATSGPTSTQLAGNRNKIINGNCAIFQRGTNLSTTNSQGYYVDRWWGFSGASTAATYSQVSSTGLAGFPYAVRAQRNSGNTGANGVYTGQIVESNNLQDLQGQSVAISFWARAGANFSGPSGALTVFLRTGTTADQGLNALIIGWTGGVDQTTNVTLTTSWQKFTVTTFTVASNVQELTVFFAFDGAGTAGANDYYDITGLQLERGATATPFENRTFTTELQFCQRYYQTSYPLGTVAQGFTNVTDGATFICINLSDTANGGPLPVSMRATPTFATYSSNGGVGANSAREGGGGNVTGITLFGGTTNNLPRLNKTAGLSTQGAPYTAHWTANAEL